MSRLDSSLGFGCVVGSSELAALVDLLSRLPHDLMLPRRSSKMFVTTDEMAETNIAGAYRDLI